MGDEIWMIVPLIALTIPFYAIYMWQQQARLAFADKERARETFERVMRDKLDVIKTAIAMGMGSDELQSLDQRLERLIGAEEMHKLLHQTKPVAPAITSEMMDADLVSEIEDQRQKQRERGDSQS